VQTDTIAGNEGLIGEIETAKHVNVCKRTLVNWRNQGLVPWYKIGGRVLYRLSEVDRVINERYRRGAM
jgi:hypothetical protein